MEIWSVGRHQIKEGVGYRSQSDKKDQCTTNFSATDIRFELQRCWMLDAGCWISKSKPSRGKRTSVA